MEIVKANTELAALVHVTLHGAAVDAHQSIAELKALAQAANVIVAGYICQKRARINSSLYVGKGKALQIAQYVQDTGVNVVIFDNDLSPAQIRELEEIIGVKVIDRSELILDIFAARASTAEAKMQVELAQLKYTYPRLARMWSHLDTVVGGAASGGVGTRGPGESQLETDRRLVNNRIAALTSQIKQIDDRKRRQVLSRGKNFTVSLVGYTNAGKSTLMNTLTGSDAFTADQLFATLDTKTTRWTLDRDNHVLLSDTVGFVRDLPHHLIASFRATLEEAINADLLLHVLDVSHPQVFQQVDAVNKVLSELGCDQKDIILVPNKIDKPDGTSCSDAFAAIYPDAIAVSSRSGKGIDKLTEAVLSRLIGKHVHLRISFPQTNGRIPSFLRAHGSIISEHYHDSQVTLEARLGRRQLPQLQQLHPTSCEAINPPAT